jgi:hypothetical protein
MHVFFAFEQAKQYIQTTFFISGHIAMTKTRVSLDNLRELPLSYIRLCLQMSN